MNRHRFSLRTLMGVVAVVAAGLAAWRIPWLPLRASAFFALVAVILLTATLGAALNRGASWVGFALFGWGWLCLSFVSLAIASWKSTADRMPVPMPFPSIWLLEVTSSVLGNDHPRAGEAVAVVPNRAGGHSLVSYSLVQIVHLWSSLLAACLGSLLARWLDGGHPRSNSDDARRIDHSAGGVDRAS